MRQYVVKVAIGRDVTIGFLVSGRTAQEAKNKTRKHLVAGWAVDWTIKTRALRAKARDLEAFQKNPAAVIG